MKPKKNENANPNNKYLYKLKPIRPIKENFPDLQAKQRWHKFLEKLQGVLLKHPTRRHHVLADNLDLDDYDSVSEVLGLPTLEEFFAVDTDHKKGGHGEWQRRSTVILDEAVIKGYLMATAKPPSEEEQEQDDDKYSSSTERPSTVVSTGGSRREDGSDGKSKKSGDSDTSQPDEDKDQWAGNLRDTFHHPDSAAAEGRAARLFELSTPSQRRLSSFLKESLGEDDDHGWDLCVHPPTPPSKRKKEDVLVDKRSPYQKLFVPKLSESMAKPWREFLPNEESFESNKQTAEKEDLVFIDHITRAFEKWAEEIGIGGPKQKAEHIKELFDVGLGGPASNYISLDLQEINTVPDIVADSANVFEKSQRACLYREVMRDAIRARRKKKGIMEEIEHKWFNIPSVPQDVITRDSLWRPIQDTEFLPSYCRWLGRQPNMKMPDYLIKNKHYENAIAEEKATVDAIEELLAIDLSNVKDKSTMLGVSKLSPICQALLDLTKDELLISSQSVETDHDEVALDARREQLLPIGTYKDYTPERFATIERRFIRNFPAYQRLLERSKPF